MTGDDPCDSNRLPPRVTFEVTPSGLVVVYSQPTPEGFPDAFQSWFLRASAKTRYLLWPQDLASLLPAISGPPGATEREAGLLGDVWVKQFAFQATRRFAMMGKVSMGTGIPGPSPTWQERRWELEDGWPSTHTK